MKKIIVYLILIAIGFSCKPDKNQEEDTKTVTFKEVDVIAPTETDSTSTVKVKAENLSPGGKLYNKYCLSCHQADGNGVPNFFPSLVNNKIVQGDKETLIKIVINDIETNSEFDKSLMQAQEYLNNEELAEVLSYVRANFNNNSDNISTAFVNKIRQKQ
jgi:mono/diheme cytochrome c family protein